MSDAATVKPTTAGRQIPIVCPGHTRPLAELQFCAIQEDSQKMRTLLVSACHDKLPMVRDGITGDWIGSFKGHKGAVWSCRLDSMGYLACTASGDFSLKVWDAVTGKELYAFAHQHIVKSCEFSPDSTRLASGGHEGVLRIYNLKVPTQEPLMIPQQSQPQHPSSSSSSSPKVTITKIVWLNDTTVLAAASDGIVRFWNIPLMMNPENENNNGHDDVVVQVPTDPQVTLQVDAEIRDMELSMSQNVLTIAAGTKVSFFDLSNHQLIHSYSMPIHFKDEGGATLHPSGQKFVAGGSDLWVRVFDFETGKELECHKGHHGPIRCVRYAPDGNTYATGSEDGTIRLWKTDP
mmetsp:Transcript_13268/g.18498  ORF Transcript_13268/g.18498 Transcript_13268/m.18498 type:complete len:348 (+) Transcript_13268:174-1217(+)